MIKLHRRAPSLSPKARKGLRTAVSGLFSFLLSLFLLAATALNVVRSGISLGAVQSAAAGDCTAALLTEIETAALDYTLPTGIDPSVLDNIFYEEELSRAVAGSVASRYTNTPFTPDTAPLEQRLNNALDAYARQENLPQDQQTQEGLKAFCQDILSLYTGALNMPLVGLIGKAAALLNRYYPLAMAAAVLLTLVPALALLSLYHNPHRALRYWCYAALASAIMTFAAPFALYVSGTYARLTLTPRSFYLLVVGLAESLIFRCFFAAGLWLAAAAALMLTVASLRARLIRRSSHHSHRR